MRKHLLILIVLFTQLLALSASAFDPPGAPLGAEKAQQDYCQKLHDSCYMTFQYKRKALKEKEAKLRADLAKEVTRQTLATGQTGKPASEADKEKIAKIKAELATFPQQYDAVGKEFTDCFPGKANCKK